MSPIQLFRSRRRGVTSVVLAGLALSLASCATAPEPREQMAVSRAAVERASGPAAAEAPLELAAARDKFTRANLALAGKDYATARQLAEQAEADAALAESRARARRADLALGEVRQSLRALRAELDRP